MTPTSTKAHSAKPRASAPAAAGRPTAASSIRGACTHTRDAGTRRIPPQHLGHLCQLFIPVMDSPQIAAKAFTDVSDVEIWQSDVFR